jgi:SAM-dependent methyltransferase
MKPLAPTLKQFKKLVRILRLKPFYQEQRSAAFEERWAMIESRVSSDDRSFLDIGCNIGDFAARAAARGMFAIGIDAMEEVVAHARRRHRGAPNLAFAWSPFGPREAKLLPATDVCLCLSVHHYWSRALGEPVAWGMIGELVGKSRKFFFEPASSHERYGKHLPNFKESDAASIDDYVYRNFARFAPGSNVERLGSTSSIRHEQFRTLYLIS